MGTHWDGNWLLTGNTDVKNVFKYFKRVQIIYNLFPHLAGRWQWGPHIQLSAAVERPGQY